MNPSFPPFSLPRRCSSGEHASMALQPEVRGWWGRAGAVRRKLASSCLAARGCESTASYERHWGGQPSLDPRQSFLFVTPSTSAIVTRLLALPVTSQTILAALAPRRAARAARAPSGGVFALGVIVMARTASSVRTPGVPPLRVQVGTFNCNLQGASGASPDLTHWLVPTVSETSAEYSLPDESGRVQDGREAPDFYAVGFQELLPLPDGFAGTQLAEEAIARTDRAIRRAIRPQAALTRSDGKYPPNGGPEDYTLVATARVVSIVLFVYARERPQSAGTGAGTGISAVPSAVSRIKEIRTSTASTGILNLLGNKGAAGVRLVVGGAVPGMQDEVLTFVSAHLAAHDHNVPRRNADWRSIVSRLVFPPSSVTPLPTTSEQTGSSGSGAGATARQSTGDEDKDVQGLAEKYESTQGARGGKGTRAAKAIDSAAHGIYETSHLFVFGDLNYRIGFNVKPSAVLSRKGSVAAPLKKADIKRKINQADWRTLATYDQLSIEHTHADGPRVFQGLVERPVTSLEYPPTYKYKVDKAARKEAEATAASGDYGFVEAKKIPARVAEGELSGKRVPGWTDRILWASAGGSVGQPLHGVVPELFRSIMRYTVSFHSLQLRR